MAAATPMAGAPRMTIDLIVGTCRCDDISGTECPPTGGWERSRTGGHSGRGSETDGRFVRTTERSTSKRLEATSSLSRASCPLRPLRSLRSLRSLRLLTLRALRARRSVGRPHRHREREGEQREVHRRRLTRRRADRRAARDVAPRGTREVVEQFVDVPHAVYRARPVGANRQGGYAVVLSAIRRRRSNQRPDTSKTWTSTFCTGTLETASTTEPVIDTDGLACGTSVRGPASASAATTNGENEFTAPQIVVVARSRLVVTSVQTPPSKCSTVGTPANVMPGSRSTRPLADEGRRGS